MKVSQQTQEERKRKITPFFDKKEEGYFSLYLYLIINEEIYEFPVTYTAGRRKKNDDGTFEAKKAIDLLIKF